MTKARFCKCLTNQVEVKSNPHLLIFLLEKQTKSYNDFPKISELLSGEAGT